MRQVAAGSAVATGGDPMEGVVDGREEADGQTAALAESDVVSRLPGVRALILRMTHDTHLTNDLTQDVLIAVVMAIREGRIRQPEALAAYMHQSARHIVYAANRKLQPVTLGELPEQETLWQSRQRTPLEQCEDDEVRRMARAVLAELPAQRDRDLLVGYYVDGVGKAELMQRLQLSADQFDKVIFRARTRMRDRLREKMRETRDGMEGPAPSALPSSARSRSE